MTNAATTFHPRRPKWSVSPRLVAAVLAMAALVTAACAPAAWPPRDPTGRAVEAAAGWLENQFDPATGLIPSAFIPGESDLGGSVSAVLSLVLADAAPGTVDAAIAALAPRVDDYVVDGSGNDKPGALARLIMAVVATGGDASMFGGHDLVARLESTMIATGPDAGRFGSQVATYDGAFRQGLALSALSLVTPTPASIDPGSGPIGDVAPVEWLFDQQCADGSWMPFRSDLSEPCAFDPVTFAGPDTNSTSMAAIGLAAVDATARVEVDSWLWSVRNPDGGWSYDAGIGSATDPNSTGLVIAALRVLGSPPDTAAVNALIGFQFDHNAPQSDQGAFWYPPFSGPPTPSLLATNDAITGLVTTPFPDGLS